MRYDPTKDPNDAKLCELILFIAQRSANDERFGSVKLNKLLFFSDFLAFVKLGSSITGHEYFRLPKGPAPRQMLPTLKHLVVERDLAIADRDYHGRRQKVPVALRRPKLSLFSAEEVAVITEVLESLRNKNAKGISTLSHLFSGRKLAGEREKIPYEVALVHFAKPRKQDIQKAADIGAELVALRQEFESSDDD
jgi:hypothetical protein